MKCPNCQDNHSTEEIFRSTATDGEPKKYRCTDCGYKWSKDESFKSDRPIV